MSFADVQFSLFLKIAQNTQLGRMLAQQQKRQGGGRVNVGQPLLNRPADRGMAASRGPVAARSMPGQPSVKVNAMAKPQAPRSGYNPFGKQTAGSLGIPKRKDPFSSSKKWNKNISSRPFGGSSLRQ